MSEKIQSEIVRIALDDATYKGTGVIVNPTYINYFFGNNGTGKSTIAKAIKNGSGISYAPGRTSADYLTLVYDQDYIDANMASYHRLPGVFTMNAANVEIQKQIDGKTAEQAAAQKVSFDAFTEKGKKEKARDLLLQQFQKDCWDKTAGLRRDYKNTQTGFLSSKQKFADEVRKHSPVAHNLTELKRMYDAVYSDKSKRYDRFSIVSNKSILENVEGNEILSVAIVNTSNTAFAEFLKEIGATEWVWQGHADYHDKTDGRCPYCFRTLPDDFEKKLADSFDNQYEKNLVRLSTFLQNYKSVANNLFVPLSKIPSDIYPAIDLRPYNDKLATIKAAIAENINKIQEKIDEPSRIVVLDNISVLLGELSDIISGFNKLIDENNTIVAAGPRKKEECRNAVFEHIAFVLKDVIEAYERSNKAISNEIKAQQDIIEAQKPIINALKDELRDLNSKTVETETAMNNINMMLRDSGFQGFCVRPRAEEIIGSDGTAVPAPARNYEVVRTDTGTVVEKLSEGEKNFIAFLYFQQQVFGSTSADGDLRQKIVVIDDPVSSMDSSALFIVGAQVRKMIEICRNNVDNRNSVVAGNFIKQIFVLTHNAYFHREVAYTYADRYEFVSFYLIKKTANKSSIRLCDKADPDCPTERINVNPVKNSYAALWEEYKEVSSSIPLMHVIRQILEYYFLQLCGYEGNELRKRILEDRKHEFTHDNMGNEDYNKYDMASAMLSYIAFNSGGVNDGIQYIDDCIDPNQCRETFEMIFRHMNQGQHFDMMMGIK